MTITPFEMYWITRASAINTMFLILTIVIALISLLAIPAICESRHREEEQERIFKKTYSILLPLLAFSLLGAVFMPRTRDVAAIIAIPAIVNSEIAQEKVPEALNGIFDLAESWMKELKPEKEPK